MKLRLMTMVCLAALHLSATSPAMAGEYEVFVERRADYSRALRMEPTSVILDLDGYFAADPVAASGLDEVLRTGVFEGQTWTYAIRDVNFSNTPDGTVTPGGGAGGDVDSTSTISVERPAAQGGATGRGSWGVDNAGGSPSTRNALFFDFLATPGDAGVGHLGVHLLDFESDAAFTTALLRLYDDGVLVHSEAFDLGGGDGESSFVGVVASDPSARFDQALFVIGDDSAGGGLSEGFAADRFVFGRAVANPEPGTWALMALGVVGLAWRVRRRRRSAGVGEAAT